MQFTTFRGVGQVANLRANCQSAQKCAGNQPARRIPSCPTTKLTRYRIFRSAICGIPLRTFSLAGQPAPTQDLAAAFAWVKANIAARGGDPARVILAGHSSGAQLSLLVATDPRYLAAQHLTPADIRAVIGLSTPLDLSRHADGHGYGDVLLSGHGADPFRRDEALMQDASPIQHVSRGLPPTLLVVGEHDFPILDADARAFAQKAEGVGGRIQVVVAPGKDHMGVARGMIDDHDVVFTTVAAFLRRETAEQSK